MTRQTRRFSHGSKPRDLLRAATLLFLLLAAPLPPGAARAETGALSCKTQVWEATPFTQCTIDVARGDLRLFHSAPDGTLHGQFEAIDTALRAHGQTLAFAMNAGMYHRNRAPVGLYIENGRERSPLVTAPGPGNFGLLPNGVFCLTPDRAWVLETRRFARLRPPCRFASQSGPMLVMGGALHPRFLPRSTSRFVRNGVGVSDDGRRLVFAIADEPVTFHRFARFFRDVAGTPDALYFDGNISRLWAPGIGRRDAGFPLGPVVGLVIRQ